MACDDCCFHVIVSLSSVLIVPLQSDRMFSILRYQHHPKLVGALNKFALTDCDLPDKWEKRLDQNGRVCVLIFVQSLFVYCKSYLFTTRQYSSTIATVLLHLLIHGYRILETV